MATSEVNVSGRILPDGSLRIDQPIPLPPGEVQVRIQATTSSTSEAVWTVMEQIWAVQQARGFVPRSREEIDAEIRALRNEAEQQARQREEEQSRWAEQHRLGDSPKGAGG